MQPPQFITKDLRWKLLSLGLAIVIWSAVYNVTDSKNAGLENPLKPWDTRTFPSLPVLVVSSASDVREFRVEPERVSVTVKGPQEIIAAIVDKEFEAHVDLTDIESARSLRKRVTVSLPPGVALVRVEPLDVEVVIPPKRRR
jgi:hypothetical protein